MAKRDNDSVYFEKVPSLISLPVIQGAIVAKPQPFDWHDPNVSGQDIFHKLVPLVTSGSCFDDKRTISMISPCPGRTFDRIGVQRGESETPA